MGIRSLFSALPRPGLGSGRYDLVVIGMGSAGAVAAEFAATEIGLRVAAVERARVGGDCLWTGCVPSKALISSARVAHTVRHADHHAIAADPPRVDLKQVWDRIRAIQSEIAATDDDPDRIRAAGVELIDGEAHLIGPNTVSVAGRTLSTRFVLVCTGSRPTLPAIDGLDEIDVLTSENLFETPRPPDSLVIIGGGPIACELSQALNRLGVTVTMIERADRLLARDEPAHARRILTTLRDEGVDVRLGTTPTRVTRGGDGVNVHLHDGERVTAQGVFVATGRTPNTADLGLERAGVAVDASGRVVVDERNRTSTRSIYAVGDITDRPDFTHTAGYDGVLAVRDMFFPGRGVAPALVPWCTFTDPEVAHVGMTEEEAVAEHGAKRVTAHRRTLDHNDRARADGDTNGEIVIVTARGRIVGAHAVCRAAGELIHELALAISHRTKLAELTELIHVYPTLSTAVGRISADAAYASARRYRFLARIGRLRPRRTASGTDR